MSIEPATDKEIAYQRKLASDWSIGEDHLMWPGSFVVSLFQRIEYDRECIASLKAERSQLREQLDSAFVAACPAVWRGF